MWKEKKKVLVSPWFLRHSLCNKRKSHNKKYFAYWSVLILSIFEVQQSGTTIVSFWFSLLKEVIWHNANLIEKQRHFLRLIITINLSHQSSQVKIS